MLQIDARTQGAEAVDSIVAGLRTADRLHPDVVMLVRGGGARTDLIAFDNERVARTIVGMTVPVFTAARRWTLKLPLPPVQVRTTLVPLSLMFEIEMALLPPDCGSSCGFPYERDSLLM